MPLSDASIAFEVIRRVTRIILESDHAQPALEAVTRLISEKMGVEVCSLYLFDETDGLLHLSASSGLNPEALAGVTLSPDEGLTGHVYRLGELLNIAHPRQDRRYKFFPDLGEDHLNNFLGIPIPPGRAQGRGVLILQSSDGSPFGTTVEDLAYTLAAQLGNLLENRSLRGRVPAHALSAKSPDAAAPPFIRAEVAFGGVAQGPVAVLKTHHVWETLYFSESDDPIEEQNILARALEQARQETRWLQRQAGEIFAEMDAKIFQAHEWMLSDPDWVGKMETHVRDGISAAFAVKLATRELAKTFQASGVAALASKAADVFDVGVRVLNALSEGDADPSAEWDADQGVIVVASELLPSDLVFLHSRKILGIACEKGGSTSHAAILARSLGVPCLMGLEGLMQAVRNGLSVILDSNSQLIYLSPDAHVAREYRRILEGSVRRKTVAADSLTTVDGQSINLLGNVSLFSDLDYMDRTGLRAVGLYRSEFFFMIRNEFPSEEVQTEVYRRIADRAGGHEVTIRILDVGGDKPLRYFNFGREENPALGWRSIRMLLERPEILQPHLRALLKAAQGRNVRLLVPMVTLLSEFRAMKAALAKTAEELARESGETFGLPALGVMIEIPAALLQIEDIAREADFLCIGTNDLIQYLFAIDRGNEKVARYFHPYHPTFLRAMRSIREAAEKQGKSVTVCGEMAADPEALPLLLGLGLTRLSISPGAADSVRETVSALNYGKCRRLVDRMLVRDTELGLKAEVEAALAAATRES